MSHVVYVMPFTQAVRKEDGHEFTMLGIVALEARGVQSPSTKQVNQYLEGVLPLTVVDKTPFANEGSDRPRWTKFLSWGTSNDLAEYGRIRPSTQRVRNGVATDVDSDGRLVVGQRKMVHPASIGDEGLAHELELTPLGREYWAASVLPKLARARCVELAREVQGW